jgi:hypothetical protein
MGLTQEEWRNADLYGYDEPRYACDEWCDECEDFISTNDAVFKIYENGKSKTLCSKHYKEYLERRKNEDNISKGTNIRRAKYNT